VTAGEEPEAPCTLRQHPDQGRTPPRRAGGTNHETAS